MIVSGVSRRRRTNTALGGICEGEAVSVGKVNAACIIDSLISDCHLPSPSSVRFDGARARLPSSVPSSTPSDRVMARVSMVIKLIEPWREWCVADWQWFSGGDIVSQSVLLLGIIVSN